MKFFLAVLCFLVSNIILAADPEAEGEEAAVQMQAHLFAAQAQQQPQQERRLTAAELKKVLQEAVYEQRREGYPLIQPHAVNPADQQIVRIIQNFFNLQEQQRRAVTEEVVCWQLTEILKQRLTILDQTYRQLDNVFTRNLADAANQYLQTKNPENHQFYVNAFYEVQNLPIIYNINKYQIWIEYCQGLLQVLQTE